MSARLKTAQQSVHLTLGILRQSQAVFYALSFSWLDGFAVPTPAQVTQTVGRSLAQLFKDNRMTDLVNSNLFPVFMFVGCVAVLAWLTYLNYKKAKKNLDNYTSANKIYPNKFRFAVALLLYVLFLFTLYSPIFWLMETKLMKHEKPLVFLLAIPAFYLLEIIPSYPYYAVSVDNKKISGAPLWGRWERRREEIELSEINQDKIVQNNFWKFLGITILYSKQGKKILTLGLNDIQLLNILESVRNEAA